MKNPNPNAKRIKTANDNGARRHLVQSLSRTSTTGMNDQHAVESARKPPLATTDRRGESSDAPLDLSYERHYSVAELAGTWNLSENTIRRMFENEPGVLQLRTSEKRFSRAYTTLRIPESIALRVHQRLRIAG